MNHNIRIRCLWSTDPLLLWEQHHGHRIKIAARKNPSYDEMVDEQEEENYNAFTEITAFF